MSDNSYGLDVHKRRTGNEVWSPSGDEEDGGRPLALSSSQMMQLLRCLQPMHLPDLSCCPRCAAAERICRSSSLRSCSAVLCSCACLLRPHVPHLLLSLCPSLRFPPHPSLLESHFPPPFPASCSSHVVSGRASVVSACAS
eukprot:748764-Hanusia_phi.AAC.1